MKIRNLLEEWQRSAAARLTAQEYRVRLTIHDAARIAALADMYPGRTETAIITDLLSAALDELEGALPYVQGTRIIAEDEQGDPIYEDIGPTPRFVELTRKHTAKLEQEDKQSKEKS